MVMPADDRAFLDHGAGQQAAGLRRVNAVAGGALVEQPVNDVDLVLERLEGVERRAHVIPAPELSATG